MVEMLFGRGLVKVSFSWVLCFRASYIRGWRTLTVPCCCIDCGVEGRVGVDMAMIFNSGVFVLVAILTA